jgi:hypothetical protein
MICVVHSSKNCRQMLYGAVKVYLFNWGVFLTELQLLKADCVFRKLIRYLHKHVTLFAALSIWEQKWNDSRHNTIITIFHYKLVFNVWIRALNICPVCSRFISTRKPLMFQIFTLLHSIKLIFCEPGATQQQHFVFKIFIHIPRA